jgi:hypothetical protein
VFKASWPLNSYLKGRGLRSKKVLKKIFAIF